MKKTILHILVWSLLIGIQTEANAQWFANLIKSEPTQNRLRKTELDIESQQCMRCHDGSKIREIDLRPVNALLEFIVDGYMKTSNHSIGMSYQQSYVSNPGEYVHTGRMNPSIKLIDGKVGCLSCHVSKNKLLASNSMSIEPEECNYDKELTQQAFQGNLCIQCHNK
ncbi:MAG: hypothetical protein Q8K98_12360 [Bacteroidota bacterium]|nr:hypothetical protein [Bacteroidota bacterium]